MPIPKKMKVLVGIMAVAIGVSVGFNFANIFIIDPQTQRTVNIMRTLALKGWLGTMYQIDSSLKEAKTSDDIKQVYDCVGGEAASFSETVSADYSHPMYTSVGTTNFLLGEGFLQMYFGRSVGAVFTRNLNQTELLMLANLTDNLDSLKEMRLDYFLDYSQNYTGMDPAQELQLVGVNISVVLVYLNSLAQISRQIMSYYSGS